MLKSLKKKMKDQAGLTLIELLVVIVILGIIAAVAIPMVMNQRESAEENTNAQNLAVVKDAANRYFTIENSWPRTTAGLVDAAELEGDYIDEIPANCANGDAAIYSITTAGVVTTSCDTP